MKLAEPAVVLAAAAGEELGFDFARAVDDPREARRADVHEGGDAAQEEDRRDRDPDDVRHRVDRQVRRGLEHQHLIMGGQAKSQVGSGRYGAFAARDFEQEQAVGDEARGEEPGEAGDQRLGRPEMLMTIVAMDRPAISSSPSSDVDARRNRCPGSDRPVRESDLEGQDRRPG